MKDLQVDIWKGAVKGKHCINLNARFITGIKKAFSWNRQKKPFWQKSLLKLNALVRLRYRYFQHEDL